MSTNHQPQFELDHSCIHKVPAVDELLAGLRNSATSAAAASTALTILIWSSFSMHSLPHSLALRYFNFFNFDDDLQ
jgi:hypothetical protein